MSGILRGVLKLNSCEGDEITCTMKHAALKLRVNSNVLHHIQNGRITPGLHFFAGTVLADGQYVNPVITTICDVKPCKTKHSLTVELKGKLTAFNESGNGFSLTIVEEKPTTEYAVYLQTKRVAAHTPILNRLLNEEVIIKCKLHLIKESQKYVLRSTKIESKSLLVSNYMPKGNAKDLSEIITKVKKFGNYIL